MEQSAGIFVALLLGLLVGALAIWLVLRERISSVAGKAQSEGQVEIARLNERLSSSQMDIKRLTCEKEHLATLRDQLTAEQQRLSGKVAELETTLQSERSGDEQLTNRFKSLASDILEDKSKRFTAQNQTNLNQLLEPLRVKISEFQGEVQKVYVQEGKDRSALAEQVKQLMALNNQLSKDAHNLTSALKGQAKTQGSWGELILERVLEASGLRKGHEYDVQESHTRGDGSRAQPDVVVHLPEDRHLIVDAKVSLKAYEEYANAETDQQRDAAMKRHLDSVRGHINDLSEKNYQQLYGVKSPDFVLMFIPVEPAFMLAISCALRFCCSCRHRCATVRSTNNRVLGLTSITFFFNASCHNSLSWAIASMNAGSTGMNISTKSGDFTP